MYVPQALRGAHAYTFVFKKFRRLVCSNNVQQEAYLHVCLDHSFSITSCIHNYAQGKAVIFIA